MANPDKTEGYNGDLGTVDIDVRFTAGTSGAVGTTLGTTMFYPGNIVLSVTKPAGTGIYRVTLRETWLRLKNVWGSILQASFVNTHAGDVFPSSDNVADNTKNYFEIVTRSLDTTAAATDMTSGDILLFTARLQYTTPRFFGY